MADELISREALLNKIYENPETSHNLRVAQLLESIMCAPAVNAVVLPCNVGDTVYTPQDFGAEYLPFVDSGKVFAISIDGHNMWISVQYDSGLKYYHTADDIGKTVFLTCEEAEKALERSVGDAEK